MGENRLFYVTVLAVSIVSQSCGLQEIGCVESDNKAFGSIWGTLPDVPVGDGPSEKICYMTALDYVKDYDWRSDQAVGSVRCSLVVYADGIPVMKIPVGDEYEVSSDPDMHRMINGHLYTDYSTDTETVIKKDGRQIFRYPGRESIYGMEVVGEDVFTLGQMRGSDGFAFRKNGEIIMNRNQGQLMGRLINDEDSLCFAFYDQIKTASGTIGRYYATVNGKVSQVAVREDIKEVWDILPGKDDVICLASLTGVSFPVVFAGDRMMVLSLPSGASMMAGNLFEAGGRVCVEGMYRMKNVMAANAIWVDGQLVASFSRDNMIASLDVSEKGIFCVVNPSDHEGAGVVYRAGEILEIPEGYGVFGNGCLKMVNGILNVGLSSFNGGHPVVWKDGVADTLKINGYISSLYVE